MGQQVSRSPADVAVELFHQFVDPKEYDSLLGVDFGYENLVLEGGGNKGIGYVGFIKVGTEGISVKNNRYICRFYFVGSPASSFFNRKNNCNNRNDYTCLVLNGSWL
jgi:hypothetical protein